MAKGTKIYEQEQALSVYFRDMLAEPKPHAAAETKPADEVPSQTIAPPSPEKAPPTTKAAVVTTEAVTVSTAPPLQGELKLLLCEIAGMSLAVPVSDLNNILRWPAEPLSRLPGKPEWVFGVYSQRQHHTQIVDISALLLPAEARQPMTEPNYILVVDDHRWGIACDHIRQIVTLPASAINWRADVSQRPWFTGVITDKMSSVLDIDALLAALKERNLA